MNDRPVPTRVSLYMLQSAGRVHAAEFRYDPNDGVTLTVHDVERGGRMAQQFLEHGVPDGIARRSVPATEPEAFMRTLLQPSRTTYFRWVDESGPADA